MKPTALIITNGLLTGSSAKTAHGLIRSCDRFQIAGVIDRQHAGRNARTLVGETTGHIPIYAGVREALDHNHTPIDYAVVGIAPKGGKLPADMQAVLMECLENGISLIGGLHEFISDIPELASLAQDKGLTITDIRKPADRKDLHFWNGKIFEVKCPIVAVLGMETNMGKRTTAKLLKDTCVRNGINAGMIFTGQTGWLQDGQYGFILDTTVNDFVAGELEYWTCKCAEETHPDIIFIEGQSGLRNPSGPCGAEMLVSANAKYAVLLFSPKRKYFGDNKVAWGAIPSVESEAALIRMYGSEVIALAAHTKDCSPEEAIRYRDLYADSTGLPVLLPLQNGVDELIPTLQNVIAKHQTLVRKP